MSKYPLSNQLFELHQIDVNSDLATDIRRIEKQLNKSKLKLQSSKKLLNSIKTELQSTANNHRFMQVARPARTVLNLIKAYENT